MSSNPVRMTTAQGDYGADAIAVLGRPEGIRMRPGLCLAGRGNDRLHDGVLPRGMQEAAPRNARASFTVEDWCRTPPITVAIQQVEGQAI